MRESITRSDCQRQVIHIPVQALKDFKSLNQAINELRQKHIKPTPKILSEMTGLSKRQVSECAQIGKIRLITSLDERLGDEGSSMIELIADKENDNDIKPEFELSQLEKQLAGCMDCLNNKEALVVQRKMEGVEHQVIGHELSLSRTRVSQLWRDARKKLADRLESQGAGAA